MKVYSFAYRARPRPPNGTVVIDCRMLVNPHRSPRLGEMTGKDTEVQAYMRQDAGTMALVDRGLQALKTGHDVAYGCYGGRHRSVALAEMLAAEARAVAILVQVTHLSLD